MNYEFFSPMLLDVSSPSFHLVTPKSLGSPFILETGSETPSTKKGGNSFSRNFNDLFQSVLEKNKDLSSVSATNTIRIMSPYDRKVELTSSIQINRPTDAPVLSLQNNAKFLKKKEQKTKRKDSPKITKKSVEKKQNKNVTKRRRKLRIPNEEHQPTDEYWTTAMIKDGYKNDVISDVEIMSKTRCEEAVDYIPTTLYSSLKYEIITSLRIKDLGDDVPFILAKVKCTHAEKNTEIVKGGKKVIKGVTESALAKSVDGDYFLFSGKMKVQFCDVSYHHKKFLLRFEVHYHTPNDLENPILIQRSSEFKVFARKPTKAKAKKSDKEKTGKKRVRSKMQLFEEKLNDLVQSAKKLKKTDKKEAFDMVSVRLMDVDPDYFSFLGKD